MRWHRLPPRPRRVWQPGRACALAQARATLATDATDLQSRPHGAAIRTDATSPYRRDVGSGPFAGRSGACERGCAPPMGANWRWIACWRSAGCSASGAGPCHASCRVMSTIKTSRIEGPRVRRAASRRASRKGSIAWASVKLPSNPQSILGMADITRRKVSSRQPGSTVGDGAVTAPPSTPDRQRQHHQRPHRAIPDNGHDKLVVQAHIFRQPRRAGNAFAGAWCCDVFGGWRVCVGGLRVGTGFGRRQHHPRAYATSDPDEQQQDRQDQAQHVDPSER